MQSPEVSQAALRGAQAALAARRAAGRRNRLNGAAAEDCVERFYVAAGARVLARRWTGPEGELDLVLRDGTGMLVFVEVKARKTVLPDSPISPAQKRRLEATAIRYMVAHPKVTGAAPGCRFDLALVDRAGVPRIIQNVCIAGEQ